MKTSRDARIYRVNAWREMKGRPALTFTEYTEPAPKLAPGGPEWWNAENTAAWNTQQWGHPEGASAAQREWGGKMTQNIKRGGAGTYTPIKPKVMAKWRENDPRPTPTTFFDGRTDEKRAQLPRAVKVAAPTPNAYQGRIAAAMGDK